MRIGLSGQWAALSGATKIGLAALAVLAPMLLAACTTVEGTNAMTDFGTFEREVMNTTARGIGLIPGDPPKEDLTQARAPLVLPKSNTALPAPSTQVATAQLPADSNTVRIDTSGLTEADLANLRKARVVDLRSIGGRPLTEDEARALTARMTAAGMNVSATGSRPLYLPPAEYFTRVGDANLICRAANGDLVPLNDARCPEDVRKALRVQGPQASGILGTENARLTKSETTTR